MVPDMTLIQSAVTGLKTAFDLTQTLVGLKVGAEVNAKAIELQQVVMSAQANAFAAQSQQFTMLEEIRALKEEVARIKAWERQKQRYKLHEPWGSIFVYALKESMSEGEPAHWICTNCYENSSRSILQFAFNQQIGRHYSCPTCKAVVSYPLLGDPPPIQYAIE